MRVELVRGKSGTRLDEETEVDFISTLLPAPGQRAQNKAGYLASWKQKVEGFLTLRKSSWKSTGGC